MRRRLPTEAGADRVTLEMKHGPSGREITRVIQYSEREQEASVSFVISLRRPRAMTLISALREA